MAEPIQSIVAKYQKAVGAIDAEAVKRLTDSYLRSYQLIQADARALVEQAMREGVMSASAIVKLDGYKRVMADVRAELNRYGVVVDDVVSTAQAQAVNAGAKAGEQMILDMFPESAQGSIQAVLRRMPKEAITAMVGALQEQSPLASKTLARWGETAAKQVAEQLVKGLTLGVGSRKTAREILRALDPALGMPLSKALTIARTETNRAFRYATRGTYLENPHVVRGWIWMAAINSEPCLACWAMHGTEHPMTETLDDHPNGKCHPAYTLAFGATPVAASSRYYKGKLVRIVTTSGTELTFTPNHPILTRGGWVAGGLIKEGDYVVCGSLGQDGSTAIDKNDYDVPTPIKQIAESLPVIFSEMPCSAEDFHGDGEGSDVYVVRANGLLGGIDYTFGGKPPCKQGFGMGCTERMRLFSSCDLTAMLKCLVASTSKLLSDCDTPQVLGVGSVDGEQTVSVCLGSKLDTNTKQSRTDSRTAYTKAFSDSVFGLASDVQLCDFVDGQVYPVGISGSLSVMIERVVSVRVFGFVGHVYSLQTNKGWYIASDSIAHNDDAHKYGIITKNCTMVPITPTFKELGLDVDEPIGEMATGKDIFDDISEAEQRAIMGDARFEAYKEGKFAFEDMAQTVHSDEWGDSVGVKPLSDL